MDYEERKVMLASTPLTSARMERVFSGGAPDEQGAQVSGTEKTMTGLEILQIVDPAPQRW